MSVMPRYALLAGALAITALCGCGTSAAPAPAHHANSARQHQHVAAKARTALMVTVLGHAGATPTDWVLRCDPPGGTLAHPASACTALLRIKPFAPRATGMACPMIMVGTGRITVTGTWHGQPVHKILIDGGCDLGQYRALRAIFR